MAEALSVIASDTKPEAPEPEPVAPQAAEPLTSECIAYRSSEELVAKAIAPVKREFLRPPPNRTNSSSAVKKDDVVPDGSKSDSTKVVKEKKSKRQLKRERREERNSALHLCPEIAKTGDVSSCRYGDRCRFSHDWETYKAQKPDDLEGQCPFTCAEKRCPYGLTCRFAATHNDDILMGNSVDKKNSEVNTLSKDVQKLLWKNKMKFTKADSALKNLGLSVKGKSKQKSVEDLDESNLSISNGTYAAEGNVKKKDDESFSKVESCQDTPYEESVDQAPIVDESRPVKRAKSTNDDAKAPSSGTNGASISDNFLDKSSLLKEMCPDDGILPETDASLRLHRREKKLIDFSRKLYLAPLTTVGNLPFRRVCKVLGADVTCGEMAMCTNLLQGQASEWALLRRHSSEEFFGVQICGAYPDTVARTVELIDQECCIDFIDINMGCPIDIVVNKGAGSALLTKPLRLQNVIRAASNTVDTPITVKVRTGYFEGRSRVDSLIADIGDWGATAVTVHGRSRQQRYSKLADWNFIDQCAKKAPDMLQVLGNGDIFSYEDWNRHISDSPELSSCMIARGALLKPWLFTEIKEQRHWDISSGERLDILKDYVRFGLEHWGSDSKGVETTRHFLLEWLSYTCRYIPVGLLDVVPQKLNWRPPSYFGRNDLETLMASDSAADWIRISEMLLGKVPTGFTFAPKHKSNAYDSAENG